MSRIPLPDVRALRRALGATASALDDARDVSGRHPEELRDLCVELGRVARRLVEAVELAEREIRESEARASQIRPVRARPPSTSTDPPSSAAARTRDWVAELVEDHE